MIVGLTGGIATGKSTVSNMFRELGAYVVDADVWARRVVEPGSDGLREVVEAFGTRVLTSDGALNRQELGRIIFADSEARLRLNAITHPRIRQGMRQETETYIQAHPNEPVIWDVPLLFEGDTKYLVDCTVLVYTSPDVQLGRLMARDGLSEEDARARMEAQMPIEEKRSLATYVIDNSGDIDNTREQVQAVWTKIRSQRTAGQSSSF
ncbi:dephospho-CoA kinase [Alicyclobacillus dauci]|uniref:Dephospho-CoA kinase n=1 Tax=Alicyclobacillus dauci TaxID=1475485 RepID=A0ABY6Z565_9BACL|nr:dephospho-CoA kinase [Alicyclobacillus dauci]WAH37952.1 dephospho-CoA kinase [Alicyclobacillus dauci]